VWLDLRALSDVPEGTSEDGAELERVALVEVNGSEIPIALTRSKRHGSQVWLFSSATVARIPELYGAMGTSGWFVPLLPQALQTKRVFDLWAWQWLGIVIALCVGFPLGHTAGRAAMSLVRRLASRTDAKWDEAVVRATTGTVRFAFGWLAFGLTLTSLNLPGRWSIIVRILVATPLVLASGWFLVTAARAVTALYLEDLENDQEEETTRGLRTQIVILRRLATGAVALVTLAVALMQFDVVRNVGWSLLASAGVAGVALGFAAQKSLGAIVAGLQLSMTKPVRLGDAIIVQGQFGTVEEIALTYVRVKTWDERRLIVPIEKFLTEAFENWSQPGDGMIGIVELSVDPSAPVAVIREKLEALAAAHPDHDARHCRLQVIDVNEQRALLRASLSTGDVDRCFDMRCEIREKLMEFVQDLEGGRYLPHRRLTVDAGREHESGVERRHGQARTPTLEAG
jgi:small-conductance mechanosensitive channel